MKPVAVILCSLAVVGLAATGLNVVYAILVEQEATVTVNIGINYGSGAVEWHNGTSVPSGENLLNATMRVATVEFTTYPGMGAFVTGINGVRQNPSANMYWIFWVYNPETKQYEMPQVGASAYALTFDQTVQWYYENGGSLTSPALRPNSSVSLTVRLENPTSSPTAVISGSIKPPPGGPVNVTLEFSNDQGASYQEMARITSLADGPFGYSWTLPSGGPFLIRADAQGVKSSPVSVGTGTSIPGFPAESLLIGGTLGLLLGILGRKFRSRSRNARG